MGDHGDGRAGRQAELGLEMLLLGSRYGPVGGIEADDGDPIGTGHAGLGKPAAEFQSRGRGAQVGVAGRQHPRQRRRGHGREEARAGAEVPGSGQVAGIGDEVDRLTGARGQGPAQRGLLDAAVAVGQVGISDHGESHGGSHQGGLDGRQGD